MAMCGGAGRRAPGARALKCGTGSPPCDSDVVLWDSPAECGTVGKYAAAHDVMCLFVTS